MAEGSRILTDANNKKIQIWPSLPLISSPSLSVVLSFNSIK